MSDKLDRQIKHIFKSENINVRLVRKGNTIRQYLRKNTKEIDCKLSGCTMSDSGMCLRKNVVYEIKCSVCMSVYIGSTIRHLHTRVKEHMTNNISSVFKHLRSCNTTNISMRIIATDNDSCNLRLREALFIKKFKPQINNKEEQDAFSDFLYV